MSTLHWLAHLAALLLLWGAEARKVDECAHGSPEACIEAVEGAGRLLADDPMREGR